MVEGLPYGLGGWGAPGIFKEGGRLMGKYGGLLAPFIFAFVLPYALLQLAEALGLSWWMSGQNPFLPPGPHPHNHALHFSSKVSTGMDALPPLPPTPSGRAVLVMLAVGILMWLLASLAVASIAKAVQYIYSEEEDPAVTKSIFKSLPSALFRLLMTSLWFFLLTLVTIVTISLPFKIIDMLFHHPHVELFQTIQSILLSVSLMILGFLFLLSQEVAVLEPDNYGLAALKRSAKLVQEKFLAALVLFLVGVGVGALLSKLTNIAGMYPAVGKLPQWTFYVFAVLLAILYLAYMVYMLLVTIVLYFSSKLQYDAEDGSLPEFRYRSGENPYTPLVVPAEN